MPTARLALALLIVVAWGWSNHAHPADADPFRPPAIEATNVPVVPPRLIDRLRQYQAVRDAEFRGWAPDGRGILIQTRFGNTPQLHRVYEPGGRREQITFSDEPVSGRFVPESREGNLLITTSRGGDENYQVYFRAGASGEAVLMTDGKSRNLLGPVHHRGTKVAIASNRRNGRDTDLYIAQPGKPDSMTQVMETDGEHWTAVDWSPNGQHLLINRYVSINESYPALLDVTDGTRRKLPIPSEGPASFGAMAFAADGRHVYVATDMFGEFQQLARLAVTPTFGEYKQLSEGLEWDVSAIEVDHRTGQVAFTTNERGASGLYLLKEDTPQRLNVPLGIIGGLQFSPDSEQLGFTLARPDGPSEAYSLRLSDGELTQWTYSEVGGLDRSWFVLPQQIVFESFDGRKIPAYYFRPRTASAERPAAVVIGIHGGPESQYRPAFSPIDQFYLNELGIAVIRPNVRGSAGYGKTYLKLDNAEKREDSVKDIGALLDWIEEQPELDASRVAVMGGSYGGYMVLASLVNFGERIRAGVDLVGIASFNTFLKTTSAYRRDLRRAEYGDERDPKMQAFFERIDPLNRAGKIRSALFVAHGRNDPRVPFSEAELIVSRVREAGGEPWTVYADNEGHGLSKKDNRDYVTAAIVLFLQEQLGGKGMEPKRQ